MEKSRASMIAARVLSNWGLKSETRMDNEAARSATKALAKGSGHDRSQEGDRGGPQQRHPEGGSPAAVQGGDPLEVIVRSVGESEEQSGHDQKEID